MEEGDTTVLAQHDYSQKLILFILVWISMEVLFFLTY